MNGRALGRIHLAFGNAGPRLALLQVHQTALLQVHQTALLRMHQESCMPAQSDGFGSDL